jgi:hypothetical protein
MERARFADMIDTQQAELRKLQLRAERAHEEYVRRLDSGDDLVSAALREADRTHRDAESLQEALHAAQQRLEEWPTPPAVDLALDFYRELIDTIDGRIRAAGSVRDVNAALRAVLEGAWLHIDDSGPARAVHGTRHRGHASPDRTVAAAGPRPGRGVRHPSPPRPGQPNRAPDLRVDPARRPASGPFRASATYRRARATSCYSVLEVAALRMRCSRDHIGNRGRLIRTTPMPNPERRRGNVRGNKCAARCVRRVLGRARIWLS